MFALVAFLLVLAGTLARAAPPCTQCHNALPAPCASCHGSWSSYNGSIVFNCNDRKLQFPGALTVERGPHALTIGLASSQSLELSLSFNASAATNASTPLSTAGTSSPASFAAVSKHCRTSSDNGTAVAWSLGQTGETGGAELSLSGGGGWSLFFSTANVTDAESGAEGGEGWMPAPLGSKNRPVDGAEGGVVQASVGGSARVVAVGSFAVLVNAAVALLGILG